MLYILNLLAPLRPLLSTGAAFVIGRFWCLLLSLFGDLPWIGMPKVVRDKAQSVEEYRAKRRFKQGGQK